jgi:hypothetical protein
MIYSIYGVFERDMFETVRIITLLEIVTFSFLKYRLF